MFEYSDTYITCEPVLIINFFLLIFDNLFLLRVFSDFLKQNAKTLYKKMVKALDDVIIFFLRAVGCGKMTLSPSRLGAQLRKA